MQTIADRLTQVRERIRKAEIKFNRIPGSVQLLAVSKTQPSTAVTETFNLGQEHFGENYPQEALAKIQASLRSAFTWHFIGQLQSNKTRLIAEHFDWMHSIDRTGIAKRLSDQRPKNFKPLNVCIQVNLQGESTKAGVTLEQLPQLALAIKTLPQLELRGLMALPIPNRTFDEQRDIFRQVKQALISLNEQGLGLDTLSMGMSNDLEAAIGEGATIVRVGTAIYGPRN